MIESNVICPACKRNSINVRYQTFWMCTECGKKYSCANGIPRLYIEDSLGEADQSLRDKVYKYMAWFYNFWNPFFMLPVRPIRNSLKHWLFYFFLLFFLIYPIYNAINVLMNEGIENSSIWDGLLLIPFFIIVYALAKQPRYAYLMLLAIPIKIIVPMRKFVPEKVISSVHEEFLREFLESGQKIKMLDIASGTGQALARRGYMNLNAEYTAVDLSEGMIVQGRDLMTEKEAPIDFILADATNLPFKSETFDICTNYGAFNGFADPKSALAEMARVTKKGGKILILDEQEYPRATWLEHIYYKKVFAPYNTFEGCPEEIFPEELEDRQVHQVYEFIYVCTSRKKLQ